MRSQRRRAYLLAQSTPLGWHAFGRRFPDVCLYCNQARHLLDARCREFLVAIEATTSPAHDVPVPEGRLF